MIAPPSVTAAMNMTTISGELCKKIVLNHPSCCDNTKVRIPNETADAIGHVLRLFIVEARARASIEVSAAMIFWGRTGLL